VNWAGFVDWIIFPSDMSASNLPGMESREDSLQLRPLSGSYQNRLTDPAASLDRDELSHKITHRDATGDLDGDLSFIGCHPDSQAGIIALLNTPPTSFKSGSTTKVSNWPHGT